MQRFKSRKTSEEQKDNFKGRKIEEKKKKLVEVQKIEKEKLLREVTVKIGLGRIDTWKGVIVEALFDSSTTKLVMSSDFVRKQGFKLKKIERLVYVRNVDSSFNKEVIKYIVEDIYYQKYRERMDIDVIRRQKWKVILGMLWLVHYNHEIDQRTKEVKMTRCPEEWRKQQRLKQKNREGKSKRKKKRIKKKEK